MRTVDGIMQQLLDDIEAIGKATPEQREAIKKRIAEKAKAERSLKRAAAFTRQAPWSASRDPYQASRFLYDVFDHLALAIEQMPDEWFRLEGDDGWEDDYDYSYGGALAGARKALSVLEERRSRTKLQRRIERLEADADAVGRTPEEIASRREGAARLRDRHGIPKAAA